MRARALLLGAVIVPSAVLALAFAPSPAEQAEEDCSVLETVEVTDPDTGEPGEQDVLACASAAYLSGCEAAVGGKVYLQLNSGSVPTDMDEPTESFTAGAGCGTYEEPVTYATGPGNPFYDLTIDGFVTGNIDELTVELHDIYVGSQRNSGSITLATMVEVDGRSLFGTETVTDISGNETESPRRIDIPIDPVPSETGVSEMLRFSIGGLYDLHGIDGVVGDGSNAFHTVRVTVSVPVGAHAIVWDAAEVPSGFYVNQGLPGTRVMYGTGFILPSS